MRKILLFLIVIMVTLTVGAQKILEGTKPSLKGVNKIRLKIDFSETKIDNKTVADWLEYRQASQPKYNAKNELENELKPVVQEKVIKSLNNKLSKKGAFVTLNSNAKYTLLVKPVSVSMKGDITSCSSETMLSKHQDCLPESSGKLAHLQSCNILIM